MTQRNYPFNDYSYNGYPYQSYPFTGYPYGGDDRQEGRAASSSRAGAHSLWSMLISVVALARIFFWLSFKIIALIFKLFRSLVRSL